MTELRPKLGAQLCERALETILDEYREEACDARHYLARNAFLSAAQTLHQHRRRIGA